MEKGFMRAFWVKIMMFLDLSARYPMCLVCENTSSCTLRISTFSICIMHFIKILF